MEKMFSEYEVEAALVQLVKELPPDGESLEVGTISAYIYSASLFGEAEEDILRILRTLPEVREYEDMLLEYPSS